MSKSLKFNETLENAISFLLDYKPDYVQPVTNISNLCKLLYLDFFQDTIQEDDLSKAEGSTNQQYQRLSIAGKILVLDIDYNTNLDTKKEQITNVMLVLASNFDQFNYKNQLNENIFLNNLTKEVTLNKFYQNLKVMKNMDDCTDIDDSAMDCFQHYNSTVKNLHTYFINTLSINSDNISVNKGDELNLMFGIDDVDVLRISPVFEVATENNPLTVLEYDGNNWIDNITTAKRFLKFKVYFPTDIQFNERMSSVLGPDNFQNTKSLNFYDLKVDGLTINADFMNKHFETLWKWVYWYVMILEKNTSLTDDGESIMKNGQLLKFENEIGTWTF